MDFNARKGALVATALAAIGLMTYGLVNPTFLERALGQSVAAVPPADTTVGVEQANGAALQQSAAAPGSVHSAILSEDSQPLGPVALAHSAALHRAKSGDLAAACKQAVELNDCALRNRAMESAQAIQQAMAQGGTSTDDKAVGTVAMLLNDAEGRSEQCSGVTPEMISSAFQLQNIARNRSAAHARWLATNPALDTNQFLQDVDRWTQYRQYAENYFSDAFARRRLEDLPALLLVHYPGEIQLPRPPFRKPDPARFLALYEAAVLNGIQVPAEMAQRAQALKQQAGAARGSTAQTWTGTAPKTVQQGISRAMFPALNKEFCS